MNPNPDLGSDVPPAPTKAGLAIASLVLGILAFVLSLFLVGAVLGVVGIILGSIHILRKGGSNGMAWAGIGLSILSILASVALGIVYLHLAREFLQSTGTSSSDTVSQWQGVEAPDISVSTIDGRTIWLHELAGKRVVLDMWATWCGPCVREIPHLVKLYNETSRKDLEIVGISGESEDVIKTFAQARRVNYPLASQEHLPRPYDVSLLPTTFFIDRNGIIQSVVVGYHDFERLKGLALSADFAGAPKPPPAATSRIP